MYADLAENSQRNGRTETEEYDHAKHDMTFSEIHITSETRTDRRTAERGGTGGLEVKGRTKQSLMTIKREERSRHENEVNK